MALPQISMAKQDALTPIDELLNKEVIRPSKDTAWCDKNYHIGYSVLHGRQRLKKDKRHGIYSNYTIRNAKGLVSHAVYLCLLNLTGDVDKKESSDHVWERKRTRQCIMVLGCTAAKRQLITECHEWL